MSICFIFNNLHRRFVIRFHNTINREHEEISMFIHVPANYMYTPSCHHHQPPLLLRTTQSPQSDWLYHHQDNPVTRITQSPNRPHIDNPISTSPSESSKLPSKCMCAVSTSQYRLHGIDSNSRYRFQRGVPISHRGIPYLKTHILKTSILIKSHIFRNPPFFTIV